ncbi:MAG TPA: hypothetical protein VMU34_02640, partial [Mycobacterium sp.]|nr:hypothetical protein [Mycobacterium sp.]
MRITDRARARLAAGALVAILISGAAMSSACESIVDGRATCPGCGSSAEPTLLPPRANPTRPSTTPAPSLPATAAPPTATPPT